MTRTTFGPATQAVPASPSPLRVAIERAQLALVYGTVEAEKGDWR